jgi:hypothetical protein|tara:strand:- start:390 stop:596 length:207 start_codon:yes stop_codon:yes gene_type:complete
MAAQIVLGLIDLVELNVLATQLKHGPDICEHCSRRLTHAGIYHLVMIMEKCGESDDQIFISSTISAGY